MNSEQEKFCKSFCNKVPGFYKSNSRHAEGVVKKHQKYFAKPVPKPKVLVLRHARRVRGQKKPNSTWGRPKGPLIGTKRTQLKSRLHPIIVLFKQLCSQEKCDPLQLLSLLGKAIFLDPNGGHFDYALGKFFQEILKGRFVIITFLKSKFYPYIPTISRDIF